ncbi:MAG: hypothetical protein NC048_02135 [Bacteroides sp.]|nr:hypothetical protein [Ruminococcus flavefaciens]MCM1554279.1 hypothetical protein [Bacteroides sp.]
MNKCLWYVLFLFIYLPVSELHGKDFDFLKREREQTTRQHPKSLRQTCTIDTADTTSTRSNHIQSARLALEHEDPLTARTSAEHYFQIASKSDSARAEMATILKWALLTNGQLNEDFLSYHDIPEMGLMLPFGFPAIEIAKPYSCLTMACGLYIPALSTMICATDRNGLDLFSARLLTQICIKTGRLSLARRYISYLPEEEQTRWYQKMQEGKQALWAWDSLPYFLPHEPYTTDAWIQLFYPINAAEKEALNLNDKQAACLLDYFTLLQLLYKQLDLLPFIIDSYRESGAKRLPTYVQEAFLLSENYLISNNTSREDLLQWRSGELRIEPNVIACFERWFNDFYLLQNGAMTLTEMQKKHGDTYMFYFVWDGIAY